MTLKNKLTTGALALMLSAIGIPAFADGAVEKTPAFPGAEGFGRYVTGGRGGTVYHVKNLNDSGEGSLRWALSQKGAKIIVFDVSGTIHLESNLGIPANTTIAGQSAPGDGICIADYPVSVSGNNVIVRYMRFRLGNKYVKKDGADGWDGLNGMDQEGIMIDHCSVSWSIDECCSFLGNKNTTVQWSIVSHSLVNSGHTKGAHGYGGNWGGSGASFHHNLLAHHGSRTPRLGPRPTTQLDERMDMRNNVIYNFGGNGCYGGEGMTVNIVNNYYKPGPGTPSGAKGYRIAGVGVRTNSYVTTYPDYRPALHLWGKYYVTGNYNSKYENVNTDNWKYGVINQIDASGCDGTFTQATRDSIKLEEPMKFIYTTTHTAEEAYEMVLAYAGASLHRDSYDDLIVSDTRNGVASYTGSGLSEGFINSQDDLRPSGAGSDWSAWPELASKRAAADADGDGIPDTYEDAHGLDPSDPSDGAKIASNGYSNVENYLNSLVSKITQEQNEGGIVMGDVTNVGEEPKPEFYEISPMTVASGWTFNNGCSISESGSPASGTGGGITGIKYSNGKLYTVTLPAGVTIDKVKFTGYSNNDDNDAYLAELCGKTYGTTDYVFRSRTKKSTDTYTVTLDKPATGTVSYRFRPAQVVMNAYLYTASTTGISEVYSYSTNAKENRIYTIDGRRVHSDIHSLGKGLYIINGKKVVIK